MTILVKVTDNFNILEQADWMFLFGETPGVTRVRVGGYLRGDLGDQCGGCGATQDGSVVGKRRGYVMLRETPRSYV